MSAQSDTQNVLVGIEQGGKRGFVKSGGELDIESGGAFKIAGVAVTATAAEINAISGDGLSSAELGVLHSVTPGTVAASKAAVVDANKDIGTVRNLRTTRIIHSEGAPFSDATNGAVTYTAAQVLGGIIVRDPGAGGATDVFPTAALLVAAIPGAAIGDIIDCLIVNGADGAETLTLAAGSGGGFDANQTASSRVIPQNASKLVRVRLTNVTLSSEAYVIYA